MSVPLWMIPIIPGALLILAGILTYGHRVWKRERQDE